MSYQEIAKSMIDRLPDDKIIFVINMLEGLGECSCMVKKQATENKR